MPSLPAVPKVVRVDLHFTLAGNPNVQVREFFQYTGALSTTDAATWLTNMLSGWATNMTPVLSSDLSLIQSQLTDLTSSSAAQVTNGSVTTGNIATAPLDAGTAIVIRKKIARRYRGGHPRIYVPGIPASYLATATQWATTPLANVVAGYTAFIAACTAGTNPAAIGTITHVNVSFFQGFTNKTFPSGRVHPVATPRVTPLIDVITGVVGNPVPASQRRRN